MRAFFISLFAVFAFIAQPAFPDDVDAAIHNSRRACAGDFIDNACGYEVFPSIGKGGIGIGGGYCKSGVFRGGKKVGKTKMSQISCGLQWGG